MKLKRFLAFVVSLSMVLSVVPAFSLTASAADTSTITMAEWGEYAGDPVFTYVTGLADGDQTMSNYGDGWSSTWSGTNNTNNAAGAANVNINGNGTYWQVSGPTGSSDTLTMPGYGEGKDFVIFEFWTTRPTGKENNSFYHDFAIKDIDGKVIETGSTSRTDGLYSGASKGGTHTYQSVHPTAANNTTVSTKVHTSYNNGNRIVFVNNDDDTYSVIYYTAGNAANKEITTGTYTGTYQNDWTDANWYKAYTATYTGQFNGLGSIEYTVRGCGSGWGMNHSVRYPRIYAGNVPEETKSVTVTYTVGGAEVNSVTKRYDVANAEGASFDAYYYSKDGENAIYYAAEQTLSESTTIEMNAVDAWNNYNVNDSVVTNDNTPYLIKSANLISNGNFEHGLAGWFNFNGKEAEKDKFTVNGDGTITIKEPGGGRGDNTKRLYRSWKVEANKTYVFVMSADKENIYHKVGFDNAINTGSDGTLLLDGIVAGNNVVAFETTEAGYVKVRFRWGYGEKVGNFGLYEAELDTANVVETTVKFVNSADNTELQPSATVKGHIGDVIDLTDAALVPEVITYNENYYTKDNTNAENYVVVGDTDTVTVTYTLDPVVSFTIPAVTVIEGNSPVLATTVKGSTENTGTEVELTNIVWDDCSGLTAGTHTVNGTATVGDKTVNGTVEVTVLPMSMDLGGLAETNNGTITLPVKVYGDFYVEFDFTATNLDNEWIYVGADGALWDLGQIGLGFDKAGNGYFRAQPEGQTEIKFETGKTYRFLVHGNVDTDTYSLTVYDTVTKAVVFTCSDYAFRKASDYVNTIVATSSGEGGRAALSNVKVHSEAVKPSTITFEYMCGDEVVGSVVKTTYIGETVSIAAGTYTAENGIKYATDAVSIPVTYETHTIPVKAVKLEDVTVNYVYNEEIVNTATLYAVIGNDVTYKAHVIATEAAVYNAPEFKVTVNTTDPTYTVDVTVMENTKRASGTLTYNAKTDKVIAYPEADDRNAAFYGTDAMFSASWGDDRYGEMLFDITVADGEGFASASLTLTPGDIKGGSANTFDVYAVPRSSYNGAVDYSKLTPVGSGTFTAVDAPVTVELDLTGFDATEGLMLVYKVTDGLIGVYGTSFIEAPYLTYDVRERATATFNYVCEGTTVGTITIDSFVGNTESLASGYYTAEDGSRYFVDAASIILESGSENTAAVNARKSEKVTVNYTIGGETVKTAVYEGFAGDAVVVKDVYVNVDSAVYWYEAKEYTLVDGGSEFDVELTQVDNAKFAHNTETYNATANKVIAYPEDNDRNAAFYDTDAMFSASWGEVRYGEMLFDVTVPDGDVINSAQLTLTPGDWMNGRYTYSFDIYAANPETYGTLNNIDELTVVGSGRFTQNNTPVTIDLDLSRYDEFKETSQVMLIYKMTSGLIGTYGASHGDNAPRLSYTTGELGARVEVSDEFVAEYAKGTLADFDAVNPPVTIPEGSNGYLDINTAWEGISGTNSEGISHIDVYAASVNEPIIRVVSDLAAGIGDNSTPSVVTTPGYGEGSEYVLFSFNPEVGTAAWTDIGLRDLGGKLITALRINNSDTDTVCPMWGHSGTATPYKTYFEGVTYSFNPAGEAKATVTDLVSQVDVLMRNFDPDGEAGNEDDYYTAAFSVDGNVFAVATYPGSFNGLKDIEMACAGSTTNQYGGIATVKIYSGNEPRVIGSITANYIYNDEVVHTVTKYYDKYALEEGEVASIEFPEYYYSALGEYLLYRVPAQTLTEDTDIQVVQYNPDTRVVTTLIHNWSHDHLTPGDLYTNSKTGKTYSIATRNLIPNGNFEHGVAAWYDGTLDELSEVEFVPNPENETMIIRANGTTTSEYGFYNAWAIEKGETYLFTYKATGLSDTYAGITQTDVVDTVSYDPTLSTKLVDGENQIVFEAESDFLKLNIGWSKDAEVGSFGLYKLDMIRMGNIERTIIEGSDPVLPKYVSTYEDGVVDRVIWREEELNSLKIGENTVTGDLYTEIAYAEDATDEATDSTEDEGYIVEGDKVLAPVDETITATITVYPLSFTHDTINSFMGQSTQANHRLERAVTGKFIIELDVTVQQYGDLWIIPNDSAMTNDSAYFSKDQILISPSYFGGEVKVQDGDGVGYRTVTDLMVAGRNKPYRMFITGDTNADTYSVTVISPEGVAKSAEYYGFRTNTDKIDSIAVLTNSAPTGTCTVENIKVYDLDPIDVKYVLQKDGAEDKELSVEELGEYFYGEEVTLPAGKFYLSYHDENLPAYNNNAEADNVAHIVKTTEDQVFNVTAEHSETPHTVYVAMHKENAVLYDTYATTNPDELNVAENLLFVGSSGVSNAPDLDADGNSTTTANDYVLSPRIPLLTFNVPQFNEGEVVMLNLYANEANQNTGIGNTMKLAAGTADVVVDENTTYNPSDIANVEDIFWSDSTITQSAETLSEGRYIVQDGTRRVAIDVTDLVVKAKAEGKTTVTFALYAPKAGAYVMNREATTYGAIHQGDYAAFLEVENDTYTITVNGASMVTKGGSKALLTEDGSTTVHLRKDRDVMLYSDDASEVVFAEADNVKLHNIANETTSEGNNVRRATVTSETIVDGGCYRPYTLGVDMVDGAQVRIGGGVDDNGNLVGGSGLRFISVVNAADTLATFALATFALENDSMEIGVKVTAEGSTQAVYIPAEKWQTDGAVFTSALTNLAVSNYNRNFTAVPYIKCTDADGTELEYINAPVTRSIYKVASGLLTAGYDLDGDDNGVDTDGSYKDNDGDETDYNFMPENLVEVLNVYVNHTGVRLTLSDNSENATLTARMTGSGAYTGEAFFTVGETTYADGKYTVTLTAVGQSVINTEVFNKYVRINNNNTKVSPVTEITDNGDGTYTIVFDYSNM